MLLTPMPELVGIARQAAEGKLLAEKRRVEYRTLPTRHWLNRCNSTRVSFDWTINPYRGCEYGCKYCYARYTHEFLERRDLEAFETEIYAKDWDQHAFLEELRAIKPGQFIAIGTATDPYQPAERKFGRTRQVLEALTNIRNISIGITTKSNLVARDADLLKSISALNEVTVSITVTTLDPALARLTEPLAPQPALRIEAAAKLAAAAVSVGVFATPVLPLLTDSEANLQSVARAARDAGATRFGAGVLFLQPCAQRVFFPFLAERFPEYLARYRENFAEGAYLPAAYKERISKRVEAIRQRFGMAPRDLLSAPPAPAQAQLCLF